MIKENQDIFNLMFRAMDLLICVISMAAAFGIRFFVLSGSYGHIDLGYYMRLMVLVAPAYYFLYHHFRLYDAFRSGSLLSELEKIIKANLGGVVFIIFCSFLLKEVNVSRLLIVIFGMVNTTLSAGFRLSLRVFLRFMRKQGYNLKSLLLVGWNEVAGEFYDRVAANPNLGYRVEGYLSEKLDAPGARELSYLGTFSKLGKLLQTNAIDEVIVSLDYDEFPQLGEILDVCDKMGVKASLLPFYLKYMPAKPYIDEFEGMPLINVRRIPLDNLLNSFLKRSFDIAASLLALALLSPVYLIAAVGIKLTSPGPVIYRQERIGRNRRPFTMYKFRSMQTENNADMTTWGKRRDERRTQFGAVLRKYSVDELPQLVNVLMGQMSLVGPRPERPHFVEKFRKEVPLYMVKHLVRPGITGWAQVNGWRGDTSIVERIKCDVYYIENWSFLLDIKILFMTVFKGIVNPAEEL